MVSSIISTTTSATSASSSAVSVGGDTGAAVLGEVGIFLGLVLLNFILLAKVLIDAWVVQAQAAGRSRRMVTWLSGLSRSAYIPIGPLLLLFFFAIGRQTLTTL